MKRREFVKKTSAGATGLAVGLSPLTTIGQIMEESAAAEAANLKISLAQWSLHRALGKKATDPVQFASVAKNQFGIAAVEYVNQFYMEKSTDDNFWYEMKERAADIGVQNLLIMVDAEGYLGDLKDDRRQDAVENHFKWVNAAKLSGCHSIRVNAFGDGEEKAVMAALVDGMGKLCEYAVNEDINIIIENHGWYSSNGKFVVTLMEEVNMPNFGTLPDFGNWCTSAKWGSTQDAGNCEVIYDHYQGVKDFLPYAKGVSAKSYDFDEKGNQAYLDYSRFIKIVKESGYDGFIGIEYEGNNLSEEEGIMATKALLEREWGKV